MYSDNFHALLAAVVTLHCIGQVTACYWTRWYDSDNPSGNCDCEDAYIAPLLARDPGCGTNRINGAQCRVVGTTRSFGNPPPSWVRDKLSIPCDGRGISCFNRHQSDGTCDDYEVRFQCCVPPSYGIRWPYFTPWYNTGSPSSWSDVGDYQVTTITHGKAGCGRWRVLGAQCRAVSPTNSYTGRIFSNPIPSWVPNRLIIPCDHRGFLCLQGHQYNQVLKKCQDYEQPFVDVVIALGCLASLAIAGDNYIDGGLL